MVYVLPQAWCYHTLEPYSVLQMDETYAKQNKPGPKALTSGFYLFEVPRVRHGGSYL